MPTTSPGAGIRANPQHNTHKPAPSRGDAETGTWKSEDAAKIRDGGSQRTMGGKSKGTSPYSADREGFQWELFKQKKA